MPSILALVAAFLFAVAATLQQKGALNLPELSLKSPASLARLAGQTMWLLGTIALLTGYVFQAAALDRGRLAIIQPLLVTTVVFALPLGYFLTGQHIGRNEIVGAAVIVVGLALFALFGDPAGGKENAPGSEWAIAIGIIVAVCVALLMIGGRGGLTMKAAVYGTVAGILFGLSAALTKPTLDYLHAGIDELYPLGAVRPRDRGRARVRPPADLARHRKAGAVRRDRLGRQPGRRHSARHNSPRRAAQPARLARRRRLHRPRDRAGGRRPDLRLARGAPRAGAPRRACAGRSRGVATVS